jgi:hypothetical protein
LLTREDEAELDKEQKKQRERRVAEADFEKDFRETKRTHRLAAGLAAGGGKKVAKKGKPAPRLILPAPDVLQQSEAKKYAPPGSYVWRAFSHNSWEGRLPPFGIVARNWHKSGGAAEALRQVLVELWKSYCQAEGYTADECPMLGVYAAEHVPSGAACSSA